MPAEPRHPRPRAFHGVALLVATASLGLALAGCTGSSDSTNEAVSTPIAPEATPSGSLGPAPSPSVSVEPKGQSSAECAAASSVLTNAGTIGLKADQGLVEQSDVDRAFSAEATAGVPADAMVYVSAAQAIAVQFVGKEAENVGDLLGPWQTAYADLTAAALRTCAS